MNQNHSPLLRRALAEFERWMSPDPVASYDRIVLAAPASTMPASSAIGWRRYTHITLPSRAAPVVRHVPQPANDSYA